MTPHHACGRAGRACITVSVFDRRAAAARTRRRRDRRERHGRMTDRDVGGGPCAERGERTEQQRGGPRRGTEYAARPARRFPTGPERAPGSGPEGGRTPPPHPAPRGPALGAGGPPRPARPPAALPRRGPGRHRRTPRLRGPHQRPDPLRPRRPLHRDRPRRLPQGRGPRLHRPPAPPPHPRPHEATSGRGLLLVEALADDWGVSRHGVGKAVWFELGPVQDGAEYGGRTDAA